MGPLAYAAIAADIIVWAHWNMQLLLPMVLYGPINFPTGAADSFVWAHWHMQLLLLMGLHGPIEISSSCCRWFHMGPLAYAAVAVNGFAWAH